MEIEEFLTKNPLFDHYDVVLFKNDEFGPLMLQNWDRLINNKPEVKAPQPV